MGTLSVVCLITQHVYWQASALTSLLSLYQTQSLSSLAVSSGTQTNVQLLTSHRLGYPSSDSQTGFVLQLCHVHSTSSSPRCNYRTLRLPHRTSAWLVCSVSAPTLSTSDYPLNFYQSYFVRSRRCGHQLLYT